MGVQRGHDLPRRSAATLIRSNVRRGNFQSVRCHLEINEISSSESGKSMEIHSTPPPSNRPHQPTEPPQQKFQLSNPRHPPRDGRAVAGRQLFLQMVNETAGVVVVGGGGGGGWWEWWVVGVVGGDRKFELSELWLEHHPCVSLTLMVKKIN